MSINQKSMLEVTIELMTKKKKPQKATELIKEALEVKGYDDKDGSLSSQLYIDITTSSLFVYCGEGLWDLKSRQDITLGDKDGSFFSDGVIEDDDDDDTTTLEDYELVDEDDDTTVLEVDEEDQDDIKLMDENQDDEDIAVDDTYMPYSTDYDDETMSDSFLDEDKYNDYMDDYEGLYDDK